MSKNFHTRELGEISVFYAVLLKFIVLYLSKNLLFCKKPLDIKIKRKEDLVRNKVSFERNYLHCAKGTVSIFSLVLLE